MKAVRKVDDKNKTREAILNATETIMREDGYAAVSSRRVAAEAGLKSQLVHYHFGTMDELFLALFQRADAQNFDRHMQLMTAPNPLCELWKLNTDRKGMGLIFEFMALANHREALRKEIARANVRTRSLQISILKRALDESGVPLDKFPPNVLSLLMAGAALELVTEASIGVHDAHSDTLKFVENLLQSIEPIHATTKTVG
ncbi:TetR/AcrR family transcriptional regulator [Zhongshania sp.]|uniref:TetR/AcrR family transcriptional regulator n=1 Tax=Zhongshania sp. TaxID=1971902 RepID=UPI003568DCE3